ncbi:MAG TPA: hypothetical protein VH595_12835 [Verrucomicrobiae bacterium]|jgi:antitoxin (DNA-binding transcriptional repressor) of toxin-antitoxin stability system|nr:hypothetical protein [Verrucomicrobiae bacterium]
MNTPINTKKLFASLREVVEKVRRGVRFTVLYQGKLAFQIVPVEKGISTTGDLGRDTIYHASAIGNSTDGRAAADHDSVLYSK